MDYLILIIKFIYKPINTVYLICIIMMMMIRGIKIKFSKINPCQINFAYI